MDGNIGADPSMVTGIAMAAGSSIPTGGVAVTA
jgi:hypothetical protein